MSAARHRGATLLEVMVVVATVALLLSVLLPALAGARAAARAAACLSNLRRMVIAGQGYALEYGFFPPALRYDNEGGVVTVIAWDWVTTMGADPQLVSPGPLWSFADEPGRVQQCPDYHGTTNFKADPFTGYNYNTSFVGGEGAFMSWGWNGFRPGARYGACRRPARAAAFGDGGTASGTNKFMRSPLDTRLGLSVTYTGGQAFRHLHATNVAYLDGHTAPVSGPCKGLLATESLLAGLGYPGNGFLSDDDGAYDPGAPVDGAAPP